MSSSDRVDIPVCWDVRSPSSAAAPTASVVAQGSTKVARSFHFELRKSKDKREEELQAARPDGIDENNSKLFMISPESNRRVGPDHFQRIIGRTIQLPTKNHAPKSIRNCWKSPDLGAVNDAVNCFEIMFEHLPGQSQWLVVVHCVFVWNPLVTA